MDKEDCHHKERAPESVRQIVLGGTFMGRLLNQLTTMTNLKDTKKIKMNEEARRDIMWWAHYLEHYNGINMIVNDDPKPLSHIRQWFYFAIYFNIAARGNTSGISFQQF